MTAYLISDIGVVAPEDEAAWKAYLALAPATIQKIACPPPASTRWSREPAWKVIRRGPLPSLLSH